MYLIKATEVGGWLSAFDQMPDTIIQLAEHPFSPDVQLQYMHFAVQTETVVHYSRAYGPCTVLPEIGVTTCTLQLFLEP